jgi:hypothetical protein
MNLPTLSQGSEGEIYYDNAHFQERGDTLGNDNKAYWRKGWETTLGTGDRFQMRREYTPVDLVHMYYCTISINSNITPSQALQNVRKVT